MRALGIEFISVFGLPPVDFVHLAADLGCRYISIALVGRPLNSLGYPAFSLKDDRALRRQVLTAMDERGVSISLGEGMVIAPDADVSGLGPSIWTSWPNSAPPRSTPSASTGTATARSTNSRR